MKRNVLIVFAILCTTMAFAQSEEQRIKEPGKIVFHPHWFIQTQIGAAHTAGEAKFADLISPAAALNVGYKFAPAFGARVGVSGWQAKGGWINPEQVYQYKYLQGNVDIIADFSTLFCGFIRNVFSMVISLQEQDLIVDLIMMKRMHWIHVLMKWNIFGRKASFL